MRGARDREPTEAPLWARDEAKAASFAPQRIAPKRRSAWLAVLVTAVAIAGLIGIAGVSPATPLPAGRLPRFAAAPVTSSTATVEPVAVRPPAMGSVEGATGRVPVTLHVPTARQSPITTAAVPVDGLVVLRASSIRVALELDQFRPIDAVEIETNPDGMLRPDTTPAFHVELALPSPRPLGELWVVVTAYDRSGNQLGTVRQSVLIGAEAAG